MIALLPFCTLSPSVMDHPVHLTSPSGRSSTSYPSIERFSSYRRVIGLPSIKRLHVNFKTWLWRKRGESSSRDIKFALRHRTFGMPSEPKGEQKRIYCGWNFAGILELYGESEGNYRMTGLLPLAMDDLSRLTIRFWQTHLCNIGDRMAS